MTAIQTQFLKALILALAGGLASYGATLTGTVTGGKGVAVVYIDAIAGKTFPAPDKHMVDGPEVATVPAARHRGSGWFDSGLLKQRQRCRTTSSGPRFRATRR